MQLNRLIRIFLAFGIILASLLGLILLLFVTDIALSIWDRMDRLPDWLRIGFAGFVLTFTTLAGWLVWRLLMPRREAPTDVETAAPPPPDEKSLVERVEQAEEQGIDVGQARLELKRLNQRREAGRVFVSLFGEISSGKSSLIQALLPDARVEVSVRGGTTRELHEYHWASEAGDELVLVDVPGTNEVGVELDELSRAEARRAHVVLFVCDGDLSRSENDELIALMAVGKPLILVLNKTDRYSQSEQELLKARLRDRLDRRPLTELVGVQAGGRREALRILPDGTEETVIRELPPQVDELRMALQRRIDEDPVALEQLRDSAVFSLIVTELDEAEAEQRRNRADELVDQYSRKAIVGAMAAVAPGTDLLIQGYLGVSLVKDLSKLYDVPVREADRDKLLDMVQEHVGKTMTLLLAIAGNALKAFPGVGTLAGGVLHAVAYGMIFQSLGRALARSFDSRGELHPAQTAQTFKEHLGEDLEISARDIAKLALKLTRDDKPGRD